MPSSCYQQCIIHVVYFCLFIVYEMYINYKAFDVFFFISQKNKSTSTLALLVFSPLPSGSSMVPARGLSLPDDRSLSTPSIVTSISVPAGSCIVVPIRIGNSCPVLVNSYIPVKKHHTYD